MRNLTNQEREEMWEDIGRKFQRVAEWTIFLPFTLIKLGVTFVINRIEYRYVHKLDAKNPFKIGKEVKLTSDQKGLVNGYSMQRGHVGEIIGKAWDQEKKCYTYNVRVYVENDISISKMVEESDLKLTEEEYGA